MQFGVPPGIVGLHTWFPGHPRGIGVIGCDTVVTQAPRLDVVLVVTSLCPIATSVCAIRPGKPSNPQRATRAHRVLLCITAPTLWSCKLYRKGAAVCDKRATVRFKMLRTTNINMSQRVPPASAREN